MEYLEILKAYFLTPIILKFILAAFCFYCFDFISGFTTAWKNHNIQSTKLRSGLDKFVKYCIYVFIGVLFDFFINNTIMCPLFCARIIIIELKSLDENLKKIGLDIPGEVIKYFEKRGNNEK